jgi:hypothetical protein
VGESGEEVRRDDVVGYVCMIICPCSVCGIVIDWARVMELFSLVAKVLVESIIASY